MNKMSDFRFGFTRDFDGAQTIKDCGADFHELNLGNIAKMSDEELELRIAEANKYGYSYEVANCMIPGEYKLTVENPDYDAIDEYLERAFWDEPIEYTPVFKLGKTFAESFDKMQTVEILCAELPGLDCGSCGAPTCKALAEDIVRGEASVNDCIFVLREFFNNQQ